MNLKQVLILRKDLNMRKGKMVAQGAHASLNAYLNSWKDAEHIHLEAIDWINTMQTKICVGVDSETELREVYEKACYAGLPCYLVKDAGLTEFKEPTYTAVAIGPARSEEIDKITGSLKLL